MSLNIDVKIILSSNSSGRVSSAGRPVREMSERSSAGRLVRGIQNQLARTKLAHHNLHISDNQNLEKVFTNVRHKLNRSEDDQIVDQKANVLIWRLFLSTTMKAAVHLGQNYNENLITCRNTNFEELKTLLDITQKFLLVLNHEILNVSTIKWQFTPWMRSSLLHDKVIKWAKAKVYVYSDSVLCLGKMQEHSEANEKWKDQLQYFQQSNGYKESFGIDAEPIEFEWNIFPGFTTLQILQEIHWAV